MTRDSVWGSGCLHTRWWSLGVGDVLAHPCGNGLWSSLRRSLFMVESNFWEALLSHCAHSLGCSRSTLASAEVVPLFTNRDCSLTALLGGKMLLWHHVQQRGFLSPLPNGDAGSSAVVSHPDL